MEIKNCPFCGSSVTIEEEQADAVRTFYSFNCDNCGMYCHQNECVSKEEAIDTWNKRV